jgi:DNA-directed RNA polymerase specialized sigma24 family protein
VTVVASRLLGLPTRRLRHAAARERQWTAQAEAEINAVSSGTCVDLAPTAMAAIAVDAGVLSAEDAQLILATRVTGYSLREAARRHDLSYDAAKKRRQRAEACWIAWWLPDDPPASATSDRRGVA